MSLLLLDFIENSIDANTDTHTTKSQKIYWIVLDTLSTLRQNNANYKIDYQQNRLEDYLSHIKDLTKLVKGNKPALFHSAALQQEYAYFCQQKRECGNRLEKAAKYKKFRPIFSQTLLPERPTTK